MSKTKNTLRFDDVHEINQRLRNSIVDIRKTKNTSCFNSVHEKKKNYLTFR